MSGAGAALTGAEIAVKPALYGLITAALLLFMRKNGLTGYYGLNKTTVPARKLLWFLPLLIVGAGNLLFCAALPGTAAETALLVLQMLLVDVLEELLFRGLLYRASEKRSETAAIVVSSLVFGLMHLLNLFNEAPLPVLTQTAFATALGFLFALILARGGSIVPCIAVHGLINVTSVFADEAALTPPRRLPLTGVMIGVVAVYALILVHTLPKKENTPDAPV